MHIKTEHAQLESFSENMESILENIRTAQEQLETISENIESNLDGLRTVKSYLKAIFFHNRYRSCVFFRFMAVQVSLTAAMLIFHMEQYPNFAKCTVFKLPPSILKITKISWFPS